MDIDCPGGLLPRTGGGPIAPGAPRRTRADLGRELAALGPFFAVDLHTPGAQPTREWRLLDQLVQDDGSLPARVDAVRRSLAESARRRPDEVETRVAASVTHLGLVARLVAPAIGVAAIGAGRLVLDSDQLWWQDRLGGPFPLSATVQPHGELSLGRSAVAAITIAVSRRYRVADRVLWGNVASALNSAARLVANARPDLSGRASELADALLADPRVEEGRLRSGASFRRRSCCLIYRVAGRPEAVCGDCVLGLHSRTAPR